MPKTLVTVSVAPSGQRRASAHATNKKIATASAPTARLEGRIANTVNKYQAVWSPPAMASQRRARFNTGSSINTIRA